MYHYGELGTVCDNGWDLNDAQVICRELGFGPAIAARSQPMYGAQILLDNLTCTGTEMTIGNCSHMGWGINNCNHSEIADVKCSVPYGNFI